MAENTEKKICEMNIYEKMSAISNAIKIVEKSKEVGKGSNSYKAALESDVLKPVKEQEAVYRVFSYPVSHDIVDQREIVTTGNYSDKHSQFIRIRAEYRFVNLDKPDETVTVVSYGDGVDALDKAPGKAMTYADKYALMKAYKMVTGDDPDQSASDDLEGHDIFKIKARVERLMTDKMKTGVSEDDIMRSLNVNKKQWDTLWNSFNSLAAFEAKLRKV